MISTGDSSIEIFVHIIALAEYDKITISLNIYATNSEIS
jgi:hypothetical protein